MTDTNTTPAEQPKKPRPSGKGLGGCPNAAWHRKYIHCGCKELCAVCGFPPHCAVHMHCHGEKPGDPPFDHEFKAKGQQ